MREATRQRQKTAKRHFGLLPRIAVRLYNIVVDRLHPSSRLWRKQPACLPELDYLHSRELSKSPIIDHLPDIFAEVLRRNPKLVVELGVEFGYSSHAIQSAARICGARVLSLDIEDCSDVSDWEDWEFVQADDVAWAQRFPEWAATSGLHPAIDVLFIDTSHEYHHTVAELQAWTPYLAPDGVILLHDTNMRKVYTRRDGTIGLGSEKARQVMQAVEEFVGHRFSEGLPFVDFCNGWLVIHEPICNGFTVLQRIQQSPTGQ